MDILGWQKWTERGRSNGWTRGNSGNACRSWDEKGCHDCRVVS